MYLLQNGIASAMFRLSTSALRTLSRLHVPGLVLSTARGVEKAGTADNKRAKRIAEAMFDRSGKKKLGPTMQETIPPFYKPQP